MPLVRMDWSQKILLQDLQTWVTISIEKCVQVV